jgi:hypothetical protein
MQVLKLFRKYNHVLLMVFMSLLLVAFLVPEAVQGCNRSQMQNEPVGQAFGGTIFQHDLRQADSDLSIVGTMMGRRPFPPLDFYLLSEEAARLGVRVSPDSIRKSYEQAGLGSGVVSEIAQRFNISHDGVYQALARFSQVMQAYGLVQSGVVASAPRIRQEFRNDKQQATIRVSVVSDDMFADKVPEPTEEELVAHFEAGRDRTTAHEDDGFLFGYRHGDRVQVEYLTVDPVVVERTIRVSRKEADDFYDSNAKYYVKRVPVTPATSTTQPTPPRFETRQLGRDEALEQVRDDVRKRKAALAAQRLLNEIDREANAGWVTADLDAEGFAVPPVAAADVSWEELAQRFSSRYPVIYQKTELLGVDELRQVPGVGRAIFGRSPFAELAVRVKGLLEPSKEDSGQRLSLYQPSPVLTVSRNIAGQTMPYQTYIFRVVRVAPAAAPASLDEVREQVASDVKTKKAHEIAGEYARKLAEKARELGLDQAVSQSEELVAAIGQAEQAARDEQGRLPFNKRYAELLGPFTPNQPLTREALFIDTKLGYLGSLASKVFEAGEHSVIAAPMAPSRRWAVIEVLDIEPLYEGNFDLERVAYGNKAIGEAAQTFDQEWFDPLNIHKRTGYQPRKRPEEPVE